MNGFMTICPEDFPGERKIFFAGEKPLDKTIGVCYYNKALADVAHLVERHLAKVEVASSSLVIRSMKKTRSDDRVFFVFLRCFLPQALGVCSSIAWEPRPCVVN